MISPKVTDDEAGDVAILIPDNTNTMVCTKSEAVKVLAQMKKKTKGT